MRKFAEGGVAASDEAHVARQSVVAKGDGRSLGSERSAEPLQRATWAVTGNINAVVHVNLGNLSGLQHESSMPCRASEQ